MRSLGNGRSETEPTFGHLYEQALALHDEILDFEASMQSELEHLHGSHHDSGRNLLHYVALRQHDVRDLQHELSARCTVSAILFAHGEGAQSSAARLRPLKLAGRFDQ